MTTGLYTGTFDPVHDGHLDLIQRAAALFDEVVVAVLTNPVKGGGLLAVDERVRLLDASTAHLSNVRCVAHEGLAVDAARAVGASTLVRSVHKEQRNELAMAAHNEHVAGIPTTFVGGDPDLAWVSSSLVRQLVAGGDWARVREVVPLVVADALVSARQPL